MSAHFGRGTGSFQLLQEVVSFRERLIVDLFFCFVSPQGTWRTKVVTESQNFMKISNKIPLQVAATIAVNPTTAYRMLKDFLDLKPGAL